MKAIFFDHDGTLIDSEVTHFELWKTMLADMGKELTFDYYHTRMAGISVMNNASDIIRDFSLALTPEELFQEEKGADTKVFTAPSISVNAWCKRSPYAL